MHLNGSESWKQASLRLDGDEGSLTQTRVEDDEYIGCYSPTDRLTIHELRQLEQQVRAELRNHCPKLAVDKVKVHLMPQVFIS